MKDRIKIVMDYAKLSQQDFSHKLGVSPASLSSIFTGRTNPTNNHVQAIHRVFPEINVSWLLFGEGEMLAVDTLVERSGMAVASINALLVGLDIAGVVRQLPGGRYEKV